MIASSNSHQYIKFAQLYDIKYSYPILIIFKQLNVVLSLSKQIDTYLQYLSSKTETSPLISCLEVMESLLVYISFYIFV